MDTRRADIVTFTFVGVLYILTKVIYKDFGTVYCLVMFWDMHVSLSQFVMNQLIRNFTAPFRCRDIPALHEQDRLWVL